MGFLIKFTATFYVYYDVLKFFWPAKSCETTRDKRGLDYCNTHARVGKGWPDAGHTNFGETRVSVRPKIVEEYFYVYDIERDREREREKDSLWFHSGFLLKFVRSCLSIDLSSFQIEAAMWETKTFEDVFK